MMILIGVWLFILFPTSLADWASLTVFNKSGYNWKDFCAIYNPAEVSVANTHLFVNEIKAVQPPQDEFGCTGLPSHSLNGSALVVSRGNCTFVDKALVAQSAGADLLIVVYNESRVFTIPDLQTNETTSVIIPVMLISNVSGENLSKLMKEAVVYVNVYISRKLVLDPSIVLVFAFAVITVLLGSYLANSPFDFMRYGVLFHKGYKPANTQKLIISSDKLSSCAVLAIIMIMLVAICCFLVLLYFFYYPMVYIALGFYVIAATIGLYDLLSPFVGLVKIGDHCRVPENRLPLFKYRPGPLFFVTVLLSIVVVIWWLVERHSSYAWIIHNFLGFAFITYLLKRLTFLQVWIVALLMVVLFFYDIFMVFITPYFTHDHVSVMEKAAVGPQSLSSGSQSPETLPMVFTVPYLIQPSKLDTVCSEYFTQRYRLLGYGDVGIPGLLITLSLKFDYHFHSTKCYRLYYCVSGIAYIIGLVITFVVLEFMKSAQPALLYLVPATLGSTFILSLIKKEFVLFFTGKPHSHIVKKRTSDFKDNSGEKEHSETEVDSHETTEEHQALISTDL